MNRRADVTAGLVVALATLMSAEAAVRLSYDTAVKKIAAESATRAATDPAAAARWAVDARNLAKRDARRWDLEVLRLRQEARNQARYGDPLGPSYAQLRANLDDTAILASAARTDAKRDSAALLSASLAPATALGAGLWRGFIGNARDTLRAWMAGPVAWCACRALGALAVALATPFGHTAQQNAAFIALFFGIGLGVYGARRLVPEETTAEAAHL